MSLVMLLRDCRTLITAMQVYLNLKLLWLFKSSVQPVVCFLFHVFHVSLFTTDTMISLMLGYKSRVGLALSEYQIKPWPRICAAVLGGESAKLHPVNPHWHFSGLLRLGHEEQEGQKQNIRARFIRLNSPM